MSLEKVINNCSIENLQDFFSYRNSNFRRIQEDYSNYRDENFSEIKSIGQLEFDEITKIKFFYIETSKELNHRSIKKLQYDLGKKIIRDNSIDAGIFIFYDKVTKNFRFSFIYVEYLGIRREFSYYKRFTFFVSPSLTNKTFIDQISKCNFSSINEIKEAFSVEPVTKQFYKELQNWYFYSLDKVYFPSNENEINLIRLITRIIFIWFIKEKGLINPNLFDKNKIKDIVKDFYEDKEAHNYYNAILQNLFFATLNQKIEERRFVKEGNFNENKKEYGIKNLFRYKDKFLIEKEEDILKLFENIPFLNGGLFDCLDKEDESNKIVYIDGFSRNESKKAKIPDYLFFEEKEINCDLSKYGLEKNAKVRGLIDILQSYNFTIDEASEIDQEVALDPELLGKVFENLLASYNEETKENARKQTGSFYTPREIVNFMVTQSLSKYFENKFIEKFNINDEKKIKEIQEKLNDLLSYNEEKHKFDDEEVNLLINSIDNIKILDPACGSGAFPMGILHKIVFILSKLDPNNEKWKNKQIEKANNIDDYVIREKTIDDIEKSFENNELDYGRKLYIVQNCIFGVDIQNIAIQISKLRFFISLVIDQDIKRNDYNFGIIPLPNLETKFVCANALIDIKRNENEVLTFLSNSLNVIDTNIHSQIKEKEEKLKKVRENYFNAKTFQQKKKCIEKDNQIRNEIINLLIENKFDENEAKKLAKWNPYDPNSSADFFNSEWMFGITDGFDIVIGNPPYIQLQKNSGKLANLYSEYNYQTLERTGDIYCLFYEKGINLLKDKGILVYITSNKWMRAGYGKKLRSFFLKYNPKLLIDLGPNVFENATVDTNILFIEKSKYNNEMLGLTLLKKENKNINIAQEVKNNAVLIKNLSSQQWYIGNEKEQKLKEKIEKIGKPLKDWDVKINCGIKTGLNEAFIIDTNKKNEILNNCKTTEERQKTEQIIKPILRGRDIKRYSYQWADLWIIFIPWHFPLHEDKNIQGSSIKAEEEFKKQYPCLYNYLLNYKDKLFQRNKDETGIRYEWYALQRCANTYYQEFEKEKVIWNIVTNTISYSFVPKDYFLLNSTFFITGDYSKYFLGLLNSKLLRYWTKNSVATLGKGGCGAKIYIENSPLVQNKNIEYTKQIENLVNKILEIKEKNNQADTTDLEKEIDRLVYQLYDLTNEEISIIENN